MVSPRILKHSNSQFIQPSIIFLKNLFVAVRFDIVMGATNKSMNGKHCNKSNGHNLSDNNIKYSNLQ